MTNMRYEQMVTNQLKNIAKDRKRIGEGRKRSEQEALFMLAWRLNRKFKDKLNFSVDFYLGGEIELW